MVLSPDTAALTMGCFRRFSPHAFTMNARNVRFTPRSAYPCFALARSCATRVKSTSKKLATCADTRFDITMWSAVILRILDHGSTRSPGQAALTGCVMGPGAWGLGPGVCLVG